MKKFVASWALAMAVVLSVSSVRADEFRAGQCFDPNKFTALLKEWGYKQLGRGWEVLRATQGDVDVKGIRIWHNADAKTVLVMQSLDDKICIAFPYRRRRRLHRAALGSEPSSGGGV